MFVDLLVAAPAVRLPEVFAVVRDQGLQGEDHDVIRSLRENYVAEFRSGPVRVEILVPAIPYHHEVLRRAVLLEVAGQQIPIVTVEDLILLKLLWNRTKDRADVQALLSVSQVDETYLRSTLAELLPEDDPRHGELSALMKESRG